VSVRADEPQVADGEGCDSDGDGGAGRIERVDAEEDLCEG
jgi:hypothetical protein